MVQCRNHLSSSDCVSCFTTGVAQISRCSAANGARVIYDGCFLSFLGPPLSFFSDDSSTNEAFGRHHIVTVPGQTQLLCMCYIHKESWGYSSRSSQTCTPC